MAQAMTCDGPDGGPADYVVSMIADAEVVAFCGQCFADFCQAYLQAVDPARLAPPPETAPRAARPRRPRATKAKAGGELDNGQLAGENAGQAARIGKAAGDDNS